MKRIRMMAIAGIAALLMSSCSGNPPPQSPPVVTTTVTATTTPAPQTSTPARHPDLEEKTVVIDAQKYTCAQSIGSVTGECPDSFAHAFRLWGDNLNSYVNSGKLGPLGNGYRPRISRERVVMLGLLACGMREAGKTEEEFLEIAVKIPEVAKIPPITKNRDEVLSFWRESKESLCIGL